MTTEPETRWTLLVESPKQTAIPWCTTHDSAAASPSDIPPIYCAVWEGFNTNGACDILTGGPDHKWWKDE